TGQTFTFNVTASGSGPFSYQWRNGGLNVNGATNAGFTLSNLTTNDAGNYDVVLAGACGTVMSDAVKLTVNSVPSIASQPVGEGRCAGQSMIFIVTAVG